MQFKIAAYLRVSTEEQAQLVEGSLDSQKYRMTEFVKARCAEKKDWGKMVDFYIDDGYSAKDTKRPAYQRMMEDIRKGKVNLILVADLSRLSRNILDFSNLLDFLDKWKARFLSMKEQFDTSTPAGKMMVFNMINLAQFEREQTSERVALNAHARAMRGLLSGGRAILGFERDPNNRGMLVVNQEEATVVKKIFEVFLEEGDRAKTCKRLHELYIFPKGDLEEKPGGKSSRWNINTLGRLLRSEAYIGRKEVNRGNKDVDPNELKPWQRYQVVAAAWSPIISEDLFDRVQRLLDEQGTLAIQRRANSETRIFWLSGLLSCGECGNPLMGHTSHGKKSKHRYYVHSVGNRHHGCKLQRYRADDLEDMVIDHLTKYGLDRAGYLKNLTKNLQSASKDQRSGLMSERKRVQEALKAIEGRISSMWKIQSQGALNGDALKMISDQLNTLAQEKRQLMTYFEDLEESEATVRDIDGRVDFVGYRMDEFIRGWRKASPAKRKMLLKRAIQVVIAEPDNVSVAYWASEESAAGFHEERERQLAVGNEIEPTQVANVAGFNTKKPSRDEKVLSSFRIKVGRGDRIVLANFNYLESLGK